jgi:ABC-type sugar transport system permease subunit
VPWLLLAPAIGLCVFLIVAPYALTFLYAFTNAQLTSISSFSGAGLSNFRELFNLPEPRFSMELITTAAFTGFTVVGSLGLGTVLALAVYGLRPRTRAVLQALILVPWTVAAVITGYTWTFMYGAQVDGAGPLTTIRRVVLPNIRQAFLLATLVATVSGLNVFDIIFVITHGGPIYQTETLSLLMYRLTFVDGEVGAGAAVTVILFALTLVLSVAYAVAWRREARKWS